MQNSNYDSTTVQKKDQMDPWILICNEMKCPFFLKTHHKFVKIFYHSTVKLRYLKH